MPPKGLLGPFKAPWGPRALKAAGPMGRALAPWLGILIMRININIYINILSTYYSIPKQILSTYNHIKLYIRPYNIPDKPIYQATIHPI